MRRRQEAAWAAPQPERAGVARRQRLNIGANSRKVALQPWIAGIGLRI
jgi:hypothetical protein